MAESVMIFLSVAAGLALVGGLLTVVGHFEDLLKALGSMVLSLAAVFSGVWLLVKQGGWLGAIGICLILVGLFGTLGAVGMISEELANIRKRHP